ncbi:MAG: hypothetical protein KDE27_17570, partial [Planctomycetes bacterium]|nr:hypothetical protein [Planctomycetota bacterium]
IALAATDTQSDRPAGDGERRVLVGKELRRVKDLLVASGGARVRFSRRHGLLFVDRDEAVHSANCLRFEARADHGSLDAFAGDENARARLYSAQFLQPWRHETAPDRSELVLRGRIGRGPVGWDTELRISGRASESRIRLELTVRNRISDWRLRARLLGVPPTHIEHECDDVREVVTNDGGGFVAFTLVRACGSLLVDGEPIAVPAAQCHGEIRHVFHLGVAD